MKSRSVKISLNFKLTFLKKLKKIGYHCDVGKKGNISKIVKAFQRHYRQELINGIIDKESLIIANNLCKKL